MDAYDIMLMILTLAVIIPSAVIIIPLYRKVLAVPSGVELGKTEKKYLDFLFLVTALFVVGVSWGIPHLYVFLSKRKAGMATIDFSAKLSLILCGVCWLVSYFTISREHLPAHKNKTIHALLHLIPASFLLFIGVSTMLLSIIYRIMIASSNAR